MFYCAYRKHPGELDVGEEHPLSLDLSHVLCIKVSCIRRNGHVMIMPCSDRTRRTLCGYFTEYPRYRLTMILRCLARNSRIVRQIPTSGWKNVGKMLHGFYDAPDISLAKIEASPRGLSTTELKYRRMYANIRHTLWRNYAKIMRLHIKLCDYKTLRFLFYFYAWRKHKSWQFVVVLMTEAGFPAFSRTEAELNRTFEP